MGNMNHLKFTGCKDVDMLSDVCVLRFKHEFGHYSRPETERNTRNFYKITLINKGEGTLFCNDAEFHLSAGMIFLTHPDDLTSYRIDSEYLDIFDVIFKKIVLKEIHDSACPLFKIFSDDFNPEADSKHINILNSDRETSKLINLMYLESQRDAVYHTLAGKLYLQLLLIQLERIYRLAQQTGVSEGMVAMVNESIESNFSTSLHFSELAARAGVTRAHLGRVYRQSSGSSISQALKERRLRSAAELLKGNDLNIARIALRSGFQDLSYFYRVFKMKFKQSPTEFRNKYGFK